MAKYSDVNHDNLTLASMWKDFSSSGLTKKNTKPSAKFNHEGVLINDEDEITELLAKEIEERMRNRPIREDLWELHSLDNELFDEKMKKVSKIPTKPFVEHDLDLALKCIRSNKARDHEGMSPVLFKNGIMGSSLKEAIVDLSNRVKEDKVIPNNMSVVRVTCVPKAGSLRILKNLRGIFNVLLLRALLLRMIYNRNYPSIEDNFSNLSFGARKSKSSLNNVFVINAVVNEVKKDSSRKPINVTSVDYIQMFDCLQLKKAMISLINGGLENEDAILIYNANREVDMTVKNFDNISSSRKIVDAVLQGDTMAPIIASVDMDDIAKDWMVIAGENVFKYRGVVPVSSLGLMDDLLLLSEVGRETTRANSFINASSASKGLQFSSKKCSSFQVINNKSDCLTNVIKVDNWVEERSGDSIVDTYMGKTKFKDVESFKYMGSYVQNDAGNATTIDFKLKKSLVTINKVKSKLNFINPGRFRYEATVVVRDSILMGSLLYGVEVLYNWKKEETTKLEKVDAMFLREMLELDSHTPHCLILLELGLEPIEVKIMVKRLLFLKYILDNPDDLCALVLNAQFKKTVKGDWWRLAKDDLKELTIAEDVEEIRTINKKDWKHLLKSKAKILSLKILLKRKSKLKNKGSKLVYSKLHISSYLLPESGLSKEQMLVLLKTRIDMLELPRNLPYKYVSGRLCRYGCMIEEDLFHSMACLNDNLEVWHVKVENLEAIFNDTHFKNLKETVIKIGNIVKLKNKPEESKHSKKKT